MEMLCRGTAETFAVEEEKLSAMRRTSDHRYEMSSCFFETADDPCNNGQAGKTTSGILRGDYGSGSAPRRKDFSMRVPSLSIFIEISDAGS